MGSKKTSKKASRKNKPGAGRPVVDSKDRLIQIKAGFRSTLIDQVNDYADRNNSNFSRAIQELVVNGLQAELPASIIEQIEAHATKKKISYPMALLEIVMKGLKS